MEFRGDDGHEWWDRAYYAVDLQTQAIMLHAKRWAEGMEHCFDRIHREKLPVEHADEIAYLLLDQIWPTRSTQKADEIILKFCELLRLHGWRYADTAYLMACKIQGNLSER